MSVQVLTKLFLDAGKKPHQCKRSVDSSCLSPPMHTS